MSVTYGMLSTYPPTQCGLATFSHALRSALESPSDHVGVVRVLDADEAAVPEPVTGSGCLTAARSALCADAVWVRESTDGTQRAAAALNSYDVAILQHEYGIFPGRDGEEVLDLVRALRVPTITVLHTVLVTPSDHQRTILEEIAARSSAIVTMTRTGRDRLLANYAVDSARVSVIPHGAAPRPPRLQPRSSAPSGSASVLTWGLLGPGKGIEWGIDAMAQLSDLDPRPQYRVVGETHPKVRTQHGEAYRNQLIERAAAGSTQSVHFDDRYLDTAELHRLVEDADVVLLPYDSREQVTSGVLIEAVVAGKPVVSTAFPHAVELLSGGAGLLVDRQDPDAIARALRRVLTEPGLKSRMAAEARRIAPDLLWSAVADRYRSLAAGLLTESNVMASV